MPELGAVFPKGFVAWTLVSPKSRSHYYISIFLQHSAVFFVSPSLECSSYYFLCWFKQFTASVLNFINVLNSIPGSV